MLRLARACAFSYDLNSYAWFVVVYVYRLHSIVHARPQTPRARVLPPSRSELLCTAHLPLHTTYCAIVARLVIVFAESV